MDIQAVLQDLWQDCQVKHVKAPFITLWTKTRPELLQKNRDTKEPCPYNLVERECCRFGQIGCSYESCVNRLWARLPNPPTNENGNIEYFHAQQLWHGHGEHVPNHPFLVRYKEYGTLYLVFRPRLNNQNNVMNGYDKWTNNGVEIPKPTQYLRIQRQNNYRIPWRTIGLDNVLAVESMKNYREIT